MTSTSIHPPARRGHTTAGRRQNYALGAALVLVNAVAFSGQTAWALENLPTWTPYGLPVGAVAFAAALEVVAIYLALEAHTALMAGDSSFKLKTASYGVGLLVGALNYAHWAGPGLSPTAGALAFGGLSTISPWLWAVRSRSMHRDDLRAQGLIEPRAVKFSTARWVLHPVLTTRSFSRAVWAGETDPLRAIALLDPPAVSVTEPPASTPPATPACHEPVVAAPARAVDVVAPITTAETVPAPPEPVEVRTRTGIHTESLAVEMARLPKTVKAASPAKAVRSAPSREQARAILLDLPDFEAVADAQLSRDRGGSDRFWAAAKTRLRSELEDLGREATALRRDS